MKITFVLSAVLIVSLLHLPGVVAEDKTKEKMAEYQKKLLEAQQKWKLQQMQQQPQQRQVQPPAVVPRQTNVPMKLVVTNRTGAPVSVFWVSPENKRQSFGTIESGGRPIVQETYAGHAWQFRVGRQVVQSYTASNQAVQQVVIGNGVANTFPQPEPPDVSAGNGVVVQRQFPSPATINGGAVPNFPPPSPPSGSGSTSANTDPEVAEFLRVHNQARAEVGVGPLQWSDKLARAAQQWADQLAGMGKIMHNPATPYGENWAAQSGSFSPAGAAQMWLGEKKDFRRGQLGPGSAGHYTQMVWRRTTHVGFGIAVVKGMIVVVANYEPAGNFTNQPPY